MKKQELGLAHYFETPGGNSYLGRYVQTRGKPNPFA